VTPWAEIFLGIIALATLAMAIVQTGQAIGGVLIFPLVALAVLKLGWRTAELSGSGLDSRA